MLNNSSLRKDWAFAGQSLQSADEVRVPHLKNAIAGFLFLALLTATAGTPTGDVPFAPFKDITTEAGISFVHENGAYGDKFLPETMAGGVAFFDFDNDGHQDL